jgi:hypothetical protein
METNTGQGDDPTADTEVPGNVFDRKLGTPNFRKIPHCIYFFYIGQKDTVSTFNKILHYYDRGDEHPIDTPAKLQQRIGALVRNAREPNRTNQFPPPIGETWKHIVFDRISYVAFALDFPMTTQPTFSASHRPAPNHTFYDGEVIEVEGCKVAICVNHMKKEAQGTALGRERQEFVFDLVTNPGITWEGMPLYPHSGGTNTGPAAPPPE